MVKNDATVSKAYTLAQVIEDLHTVGAIKCARILMEMPGESREFYDSTYRPGCLPQKMVSFVQAGADGNSWRLFIEVGPDRVLKVAKFVVPILIAILCLGAAIWFAWVFEKVSRERVAEQKSRKLVEQLNKQVGHDIASPVFALRTMLSQVPVSKQTEQFLKQIIDRIEAISKALKVGPLQTGEIELMSIVSEVAKEVEARGKLKILLNLPVVSLRAVGHKVEFGRLLSNLLVNAEESGATIVSIVVEESQGSIIVNLEDNGRKFPQEVVANFGKRGMSVGKPGGSGLGLSHAKEQIEQWGGHIVLVTQVPKVIRLKLSKTASHLP